MDYHEHNDQRGRDARITVEISRTERARMAAVWLPVSLGDVTLCMSRFAVRERRVEGSRLFKRGRANEMPYYLYSKRARRAGV